MINPINKSANPQPDNKSASTINNFWLSWNLAFRLAFRETGWLPRGFIVFILCIFIGTFALASLTSLLSSITRGVDLSARSLLDGDLVLSKTYAPLTDEQSAFLGDNSVSFSIATTLRATLQVEGQPPQLIALKAVSDTYPQHATFEPRALLPELQAQNDTILIDDSLRRQLGLENGSVVTIGYADFRVIGVVERESDLSIRNIRIAPRVLMSLAAFERTKLQQPGALMQWGYRVVLPDSLSSKEFQELWNQKYADESWRFRDLENAAPRVTNAVDRVDTFLLIVQLSTILIAGIGIANAFGAYIQERRRAIAVWKCMGAESYLISRIYLVQCAYMGIWGLIPALLLGNAAPWLLQEQLNSLLNITIHVAPSPSLLAYQIAALCLITAIFVIIPLYQAKNIPALELFRGVGVSRLLPRQWINVAIIALVSSLFVIIFATDRLLAMWFILGIAIAMGMFMLLALAISRLLAPFTPRLLRIALSRPGAATTSVCMSIGIGLTILVFLAIFQSSLLINILGSQRVEQPSLFLMGIMPNQITQVEDIAASEEKNVKDYTQVPFMRSRVIAINDVKRDDLPDKIRNHWVLSGSRIVTWSEPPPENNKIVDGTWWPRDYDGEPLVSFSLEEAVELGIKVGDTITIDLLGRHIQARISAVHDVDWQGFRMNFVLIFSPVIFQDAPQSFMATVKIDDKDVYDRFRTNVAQALPNVTIIPVDEIIKEVESLLKLVSQILTVVGGMCLFAGVLVLFGQAIARQRLVTYQTTIYRLCGASTAQILRINTGFYLMVGVISMIMAFGLALTASYGLIVLFLNADWVFSWRPVLQTITIAPLATIITGLVSAYLALRIKPFRILRND